MARAWPGRPARSVASPWSSVGAESGVFWAPSGDSSIRMQAKESRPLVMRVSTTVSRRSPCTEPGRAPTKTKEKTDCTKSRYACAETFTGKENDRGGCGDRGIRRRVFDRNYLGYQPEGGRTPLAFCGDIGQIVLDQRPTIFHSFPQDSKDRVDDAVESRVQQQADLRLSG